MVTLTEKATLRPNTSMKSTERIKTGCRPNLQDDRNREKMAAAFIGRETHSERDCANSVVSGVAGSELRMFPWILIPNTALDSHWIQMFSHNSSVN